MDNGISHVELLTLHKSSTGLSFNGYSFITLYSDWIKFLNDDIHSWYLVSLIELDEGINCRTYSFWLYKVFSCTRLHVAVEAVVHIQMYWPHIKILNFAFRIFIIVLLVVCSGIARQPRRRLMDFRWNGLVIRTSSVHCCSCLTTRCVWGLVNLVVVVTRPSGSAYMGT